MKPKILFHTFAILAVVLLSATLLSGQTANRMPRAGARGNNPTAAAQPVAQTAATQEFLDAEERDGKAFAATLAGKSKAEKIPMIREFKTSQYQKNCEFRQRTIDDRCAQMAQRATANPQAAQRVDAAVAKLKARFAEITAFFATKHQENMAFLDKVAADPTLDGPPMDQAINEFFQAQKQSAKTFMDQRKAGANGQKSF